MMWEEIAKPTNLSFLRFREKKDQKLMSQLIWFNFLATQKCSVFKLLTIRITLKCN